MFLTYFTEGSGRWTEIREFSDRKQVMKAQLTPELENLILESFTI